MNKVKFMVGVLSLTVLMGAKGGFAADQSSGCGLGWEVVKKNSLVSSSTRQTTHAFLPNSFSMTSGTSGCAKHSIVKKEHEKQYFVESNLDQLKDEMAIGKGEYLATFASLMGCESNRAAFAVVMKKNYARWTKSTAAQSREQEASNLIQLTSEELQVNKMLTQACGFTG